MVTFDRKRLDLYLRGVKRELKKKDLVLHVITPIEGSSEDDLETEIRCLLEVFADHGVTEGAVAAYKHIYAIHPTNKPVGVHACRERYRYEWVMPLDGVNVAFTVLMSAATANTIRES